MHLIQHSSLTALGHVCSWHPELSARSAVENGLMSEVGREEGRWEGWADGAVGIQKCHFFFACSPQQSAISSFWGVGQRLNCLLETRIWVVLAPENCDFLLLHMYNPFLTTRKALYCKSGLRREEQDSLQKTTVFEEASPSLPNKGLLNSTCLLVAGSMTEPSTAV